jgi:hypothetical protein
VGVDAGGDGIGEAAEVVEAEVEVEEVESASARTTLSAAWRRGCAEEMRVSRARYEGHAGSSGGDGTYDAMGSYIDKKKTWGFRWVKSMRYACPRWRVTKHIRTSPAARAARASSTTRSIAVQAHCARARLQSSGSPLRRGAKTVGQSAFFSASEIGVSAALRGTVS